MKRALAIFFAVFFIFQGLLFWKDPQEDILLTEKRTVARFPQKMRFTTHGIREYFAEIDRYFADRLLFRPEIMDLTAKMNDVLRDVPDFDRAFLGSDGWIFEGNLNSRATDKFTGLVPPRPTTRMVEDIKRGLAQYPDIPSYFILGPVKSSVYPEYLPKFVRPAPIRYAEPLLENLGQTSLAVFDPTAIMKESKDRGLLYYRTDTHWNLLGGAITAEAFLDFYNARHPDREPLSFPGYSLELTDEAFNGDLISLGNLLFFRAVPGDVYKIVWDQPRPNLIVINEDGRREIAAEGHAGMAVSNHPYTVINPAALTDLRVWLFRDSFSEALAPYFHTLFAETKHIFKHDLFKGTEVYKEGPLPDLIIYEIVERDL
ncbi:hypothetical protein LJB86_03015 [Deltaproteobacteria bacterium OttesenSCG-928-M10]|nr:hypothetical protein [Deltaproteobacteria bacterium OttesenSCG-928-M10]